MVNCFRPPTTGNARIDYLDNLRAVAMLLGVFLHAALAFAEPAREVWLATNPQGSRGLDASIWFIHLFRMSLFFLLAGYFGQGVWQRKGLRPFFGGRFLRVVVPLFVFYPVLLIAMTLVIGFALAYVPEPEGLLGLIAAEGSKPAAERMPSQIGTMHLWFLYYLLGFVVVGSGLQGLGSTLIHGRPLGRWRPDWQPKWRPSQKLGLVGLGFPLVLVPGAALGGSPLPAPESFVPQVWPFAFYGLFYLAGAALYGREHWLDDLAPYGGGLMAASLLVFIPYYRCLPTLNLALLQSGQLPLSDSRHLWLAVLTSLLSVWLTISCLIWARRYLAGRNEILSWCSDSAYWTYLIHLPLVIFWQTLLTPLPWSLWLKLAVVLVGTLLPCWATYVVFVRYTPIGWLLHGKRAFP
jgi:glucans biosynthesis protein C